MFEKVNPMHPDKLADTWKEGERTVLSGYDDVVVTSYSCSKCGDESAGFDVGSDNSNYQVYDGALYSKDGKTLLLCPEKKNGELIIKKGTQRVDDSACTNCTKLTRISFPDSLIEIGKYSFQDSSFTGDLILSDSIEKIGYGAFATNNYYPGVGKLVLPANLKVLGDWAFTNRSFIGEVVIPIGIEKIGCDDAGKKYDTEGFVFAGNNISSFAVPCDNTAAIEYLSKSEYGESASKIRTIHPICTKTDNVQNDICPYCGSAIDSNNIVLASHNYKEISGTSKPATCTEDGKEADQECSRCHDKKEGAVIIATGHKWNSTYTVDTPATCTAEGEESIHCSVCDAIKAGSSRSIAKKDHRYGDWTITKKATCTTDGSREKVCSVCGEKITESIPPTGHKWNSTYTVDTPATHSADGQESIHCSACDAIKEGSERPIPKNDKHEIEPVSKTATCQEAGMKKHFECTVCHKMFKDAVGTRELTKKEVKKLTTKKKKHSFKEKSGQYLKSAATCTKPAYYYYTCKTCHQKGKKSKGTVTVKFKPECKYYSGTMTLTYKITKAPKK